MAVNFERFRTEQCGIKDIVGSWLNRVHRDGDDFDKFYYLWAAFNSWALIVTLKDSDAAMVAAVADNAEAARFYERHIVSDRHLINSLEEAQDSFPLQSFADLVRIDSTYDWRRNQGSREYDRKISTSGRRVKVSPALDPRNFGSVLRCIYAVRCNLMHGSKMATRQERVFVHVFSTVLERLLVGRPSLLWLPEM